MNSGDARFRKRLGLIFRYGVTFALIAWFIRSSDWGRIREAVLVVRLYDFILSYLLLLVAWGIVVVRLQGLLTWTPIHKSLFQLYRIQFVSNFVGFIAPSDIGMAVARWFLVTENRIGRGAFFLVTLQERLQMMTTAALLCVTTLLAASDSISEHIGERLILLSLVIFFVSLALLVLLTWGWSMNWRRKWFSRFGQFTGLGLTVENEDIVGPGSKMAWGRLLGKAALLTAVFLLFMVLRVWVLTRSMGVSIEAMDLFWMVMSMMLFLILPISIGGIGLRELGYGALFHWVGADVERGIVLGLLLSTQIMMNALMGGILSLCTEKNLLSPDAG